MSSHNVLQSIFDAAGVAEVVDPGNAGSIYVDRSPMSMSLVSAAAETRTLPRPLSAGALLFLNMKTDGGDITLTVTGGFNETGDTTFVFSDPGQFATFVSVNIGGTLAWRLMSHYGIGSVSPTEASRLDDTNAVLATLGGVGITAGVGTIYKTSVQKFGDLFITRIYIDLTGLASSTTDLDIIGVAGGPAHIGQITAARNGTIDAIRMTCLELPAGGADDIDLYAATEGDGAFDAGIGTLVETALITAGGAWANGTVKGGTGVPAADQYLYLTGGEAGTAATYTAGKFLIELFGY